MGGTLPFDCLSRRMRNMAHRPQKDLLQRIAPVRQFSDQQVLLRQQSPQRFDFNSRRQDDAPSSVSFRDAIGAD